MNLIRVDRKFATRLFVGVDWIKDDHRALDGLPVVHPLKSDPTVANVE